MNILKFFRVIIQLLYYSFLYIISLMTIVISMKTISDTGYLTEEVMNSYNIFCCAVTFVFISKIVLYLHDLCMYSQIKNIKE